MKKIILYISLFVAIAAQGCDMDSFLFNDKKISAYKLPGNNIPDSLIKQVTFKSGGNTLYGYWVKGENYYNSFTILYCHGNKDNIDNYWDRVMYLHELGVNVFIFDYRGFGLSEGTSSEEGLHEDAAAAWNFIKSNYGVKSYSLILYGYSLGNVASIYLAAEVVKPMALIAEAPFASANSLTQGSLVLDIPAGWLTKGKFNNAEEIKKITTQFLLLHGSDDDFVRFRDNGQVVYDNAPEPKTLIVVPGAVHTNIPEKMGVEEYLMSLRKFLHLLWL
ncbi:MAG: alpha/beta hydrolase [Ignavibacteria bacterium]|jgi:alpha-beta hydrolase superfamily lysophospholipase|nr:alpha/beta hydrolase [Ignavibacteria bacterium]MCU7513244.1 alpha/beta hydrolase [Ignavibacteria bacterium]